MMNLVATSQKAATRINLISSGTVTAVDIQSKTPMSTTAIVGVSAGKRPLPTWLAPAPEVADKSKPFTDQSCSRLCVFARCGGVYARKNSKPRRAGKTSYMKNHPLKAFTPSLQDIDAGAETVLRSTCNQSRCPSAVLEVENEEEEEDADADDNDNYDDRWSGQLQAATESLLMLQKSLLEKQWALTYDSVSTDSTAMPTPECEEAECQSRSSIRSSPEDETGQLEVVRSRRPSARIRRRLACRKKPATSAYALKSDIMDRICKRNNNNVDSAALPYAASYHDHKSETVKAKPRFRLLKREEVVWLSKKIQSGLHLHKVRSRLKAKLGYEPTKAQWAASMNMSLVELNAKLMEYSLAKERLKMSNVRLVLSIARKYENLGLEMGDLVREGLAGLARGIEKFDASKGYKLSTYIYWWIRQSITRALTEHSKIMPVPGHLQERINLIISAKEELQSKGIVPSTERIAKMLNMSTSMVRKAKRANKKTVISLEMDAYRGTQGKRSTLHDIIADDNLENQPWFSIEEDALKEDINDLLESTLNKREQLITRLYYGLDSDSQTWEDISKRLGLSRERVRQIGLVSIEKLKQSVRNGTTDPIWVPSLHEP